MAGTDVRVSTVLDLLERGCSIEDIRVNRHPELTVADIRACMRYREPGCIADLPSPELRAGKHVPSRKGYFLAFAMPVMIVVFLAALTWVYLRAGRPVATLPPHPPSAAPFVQQGNASYAAGNYQEAERWYGKALELDPGNVRAATNLGLVYHMQKRFAEAESQYKRANALDPIDATAHLDLAILYKSQGRLVPAESEFVRALTLKPDDPVALNGLGTVYIAQRRFDDADRQLKHALRIEPSNKTAQYNLHLVQGLVQSAAKASAGL